MITNAFGGSFWDDYKNAYNSEAATAYQTSVATQNGRPIIDAEFEVIDQKALPAPDSDETQ